MNDLQYNPVNIRTDRHVINDSISESEGHESTFSTCDAQSYIRVDNGLICRLGGLD